MRYYSSHHYSYLSFDDFHEVTKLIYSKMMIEWLDECMIYHDDNIQTYLYTYIDAYISYRTMIDDGHDDGNADGNADAAAAADDDDDNGKDDDDDTVWPQYVDFELSPDLLDLPYK